MEASLVYLAGPIHGMSDDQAWDWRRTARKLLLKKNIMSLNPMDSDYRGRETKHYDRIVARDKHWIMSCDTVLANCHTPGYGTAMEILFAWEQHKQIVVVTEHKSPWLLYHADAVVKTLKDAVECLGLGRKRRVKGKCKIDRNWKCQ